MDETCMIQEVKEPVKSEHCGRRRGVGGALCSPPVLKAHIFSWPLVRCIIRMYLLMLAVICSECGGN